MATSHAPGLVALSLLIAVLASYVALDLGGRMASSSGKTRAAWLAGGSIAMGAGIWSMHFVGMLAFHLHAPGHGAMVPVAYDVPVMLASVVAAILASALALVVVGRARRGTRAFAAAGVSLGMAIAGMHFIGMAAMRMPARLGWSWPLVAASLLIAIGASFAALWLLERLGSASGTGERLHIGLRRSESRYRALVENSPECILVHAGGRIRFVNDAARALLGVASAESLVGRAVFDFVPAEMHRRLASRLAAIGPDTPRTEMHEYAILRADGERCDVEAVSVAVVHDGVPALQTHLRDTTQRKALERALAHQAFHDAVTGLANRVLFHDRVERALGRAAYGGARPVVLFLDLDNFKGVNDGFGHAAGDRLLVEVATRLRDQLDAADTCARLGGDEFAVLFDGLPAGMPPEKHAARMAELLIRELARPFHIAGAEHRVGVSIGIAAAQPGDGVDELLRNADLAMYRAKARGKARYELFEPAMHEAVRKRLALEAELRAALESGWGQFVIHYQPIAHLGSGDVAGFEALVRWRHPRDGMVSPADFIPIAEETGLIVPLGRLVLREACRQARAWQRAHRKPLTITVNVSGRQLADPSFVRDVAAELESSGLEPGSLVLEITESVLIDDSATTLERLAMLKALGVRIAIDDFGTGYSSLAYLQRFPVDLLKIDKAFIDRVGAGAAESRLARAILGLGGALGMEVVAEGVETETQWERLRELGCEFGQGFFYARPLPPADAERLLPPLRTLRAA